MTTMLDPLLGEARERLIARARREGLATVGYDLLDSPLGPLWVAVTPKGVATIHYGAEPPASELRRLVRVYGPAIVPDHRRAAALARELEQYFRGRRRTFDVPVDLSGITPFQRRVLAQTARIAFGDLRTYRSIAARLGNAKASRAVGGAVGANPVPIVVPCHRVVATDGTLGGYAGGLAAKRALLAIERGDAVPAGGWPPAERSAERSVFT
jgi:methylated-DNA-[protein]-cysteine S-methyltransferase